MKNLITISIATIILSGCVALDSQDPQNNTTQYRIEHNKTQPQDSKKNTTQHPMQYRNINKQQSPYTPSEETTWQPEQK
ncbi:hypothetical protein [Helicobacter sp. 11S03491-1]|uniref:hypothetical protein n=1 Tax=Helicobacter sp. 11S03491-1 TaxID=1476196 RepID=UPI000BA76CD7|nr:hypothetical protein [Helicobacter sp. 11S03491-1]PAF41496.1 hypothetical protein BKH45_07185 [Helicobacter sp. 11S03491-1]